MFSSSAFKKSDPGSERFASRPSAVPDDIVPGVSALEKMKQLAGSLY
jgi:hypothetical protein